MTKRLYALAATTLLFTATLALSTVGCAPPELLEEEQGESSSSLTGTGPAISFSATNFAANAPTGQLNSNYNLLMLQWSAPVGATCVASGAWSGTKARSGSELALSTGNYRLTCTDATGTSFKDVTVGCARLNGVDTNPYCAVCPGTSSGLWPINVNTSGTIPAYQRNRSVTCEVTGNTFKITDPSGGWMETSAWGGGSMPAPLSAPACTYTYGAWSSCVSGAQTRTVTSSSPAGCSGAPVTSQLCAATPSPAPAPSPTSNPTVALTANDGEQTSCYRNRSFTLAWTATTGAVCVATTGNWSTANGNPQRITFTSASPTTYGIRCTYGGKSVEDAVVVSPK